MLFCFEKLKRENSVILLKTLFKLACHFVDNRLAKSEDLPSGYEQLLHQGQASELLDWPPSVPVPLADGFPS